MSDDRIVEFGEYYDHEEHGEVVVVEIFEHVVKASTDGVLESELSVRFDKRDKSNYTWPRVASVEKFIEASTDE